MRLHVAFLPSLMAPGRAGWGQGQICLVVDVIRALDLKAKTCLARVRGEAITASTRPLQSVIRNGRRRLRGSEELGEGSVGGGLLPSLPREMDEPGHWSVSLRAPYRSKIR